MALTASQIVTLCCQVAKVPGYTAQAQLLLNNILNDLCRHYDFDIAKKTYNFNFDTSVNGGAGPFNLPADFLRSAIRDVLYTIQGVPYVMTPLDNDEYSGLVQTPGFNSYPTFYSVFFTGVGDGDPPTMKVWAPSSGAYPVTLTYFRLMPAIVDFDVEIPWFPDQTYLRQRLTGELMQISDDARWEAFLSDNEDAHPNGAGVILRKYLKMMDDKANRTNTVGLDRRRFGINYDRLRNTKQVGW